MLKARGFDIPEDTIRYAELLPMLIAIGKGGAVMNHLPTGMFLPGDSFIHRLDSRVKLLALLISVVSVLFVDSLIGYGIMIVFTAVIIMLSGVPLGTALNSVNKMYWFFLLILLMNTCFYSPENAWVSYWIFNPSPAGLMQGIRVVLSVFLVLVISNVPDKHHLPDGNYQCAGEFEFPVEIHRHSHRRDCHDPFRRHSIHPNPVRRNGVDPEGADGKRR